MKHHGLPTVVVQRARTEHLEVLSEMVGGGVALGERVSEADTFDW